MNIIASVEARMNSKRFPGKMLSKILGKPTINHVFDRLRISRSLTGIVLATSTTKLDDKLCKIANEENISLFRGSEYNVYERVSNAHKMMESDIIITVCGDCPLIDPYLIDKAVDQFINGNFDFITFKSDHTYPQGVEFHVFSSKIFHAPVKKLNNIIHKEHVGLYFIEKFNEFRASYVSEQFKKSYNHIRLQLDYKEDFIFLNSIYKKLYDSKGIFFTIEDIVSLIKKNPELIKINSNCIETKIYDEKI